MDAAEHADRAGRLAWLWHSHGDSATIADARAVWRDGRAHLSHLGENHRHDHAVADAGEGQQPGAGQRGHRIGGGSVAAGAGGRLLRMARGAACGGGVQRGCRAAVVAVRAAGASFGGIRCGGTRDGGTRDGCGGAEFSAAAALAEFWYLFASYLLQGYLGYIFVFWFYLYLVQVRHFEVLKAASFTALPWVATIFAIPLGGVLSDAAVARWGATWGRRSVPLVALSSAALFLVIGARTPNAMVAVGALTACTVLVLSTEGAFWATMTQLAGERSGVAGGVMNFGSNLGGMVSPALTPWLAERIGWEAALTLTAGLAVVAGLLWLRVRVGDGDA